MSSVCIRHKQGVRQHIAQVAQQEGGAPTHLGLRRSLATWMWRHHTTVRARGRVGSSPVLMMIILRCYACFPPPVDFVSIRAVSFVTDTHGTTAASSSHARSVHSFICQDTRFVPGGARSPQTARWCRCVGSWRLRFSLASALGHVLSPALLARGAASASVRYRTR